MEKIKEYKGIIILVLIILVVAFYWYEWRQSQMKKSCAGEARKLIDIIDESRQRSNLEPLENRGADYDRLYKTCLTEGTGRLQK